MFYKTPDKVAFARLFLFIFFLKMVITITPILVEFLDKSTVAQVVLQIEIESISGLDDSNEDFLQLFMPDMDGTISVIEGLDRMLSNIANENKIYGFHSSVPTPPPNC